MKKGVAKNNKKRKPLLLFALVAIWGSSFLFIPELRAYTEFRWEWRNPKLAPAPEDAIDPDVEAIVDPFSQEVARAPQSPVPATDDTFYLYASAYPAAGDPPDGDNNCSTPPNTVNSACYSLTKWLVRTIDALFKHYPFQLKVQQVVDNLLNNTTTAWPDPLFDMSLSLPLVGNYNVGMYIQDLWDPNSGCASTPDPLSPYSGPRTLADPNVSIGCKFQDNDTRAIDLIGEVFQAPGGYSIDVLAQGTATGDGAKLPTGAGGVEYDGGIQVNIQIPFLDVDVIFRQPDFPKYVTDGYYLHAAGKLRITGLNLQVRVFSLGGFLRAFFTSPGPGTSGYSVGVDLERIYIAGGIALDVDGFNCGEWNNPATASTMDPLRVYNNTPSCDVDDMSASHPDKAAGQGQYTTNTNTRNQIIAEVLKYIEANLVYEATRTTNPTILQYLTAMEALDLRTVTHEKSGNFYLPPTFEHPFQSNRYIYLDYGLFWRFNADQQGGQEGVDLPGGLGLLVTSTVPSECLSGNPIPASRNTWPLTPPALYHTRVRAGQLAFVGAGLHRNIVNNVLDQLWYYQIPCISLWKGTPGLGSTFGDILTGSTMKMFLPSLSDTYTNREMMVRIVPRYVKPGDTAAAYTANDQPRVIYNPGDPSWLIPGTGFPDPRYPGPFDLQVTAPHVEFQFLIDGVGNGQFTSFTRVLSIDTWLDLYAGVGWYQITGYPAGFPPTFIDPVGRCDQSPFPCRVLRLGLAFRPGINIVYDYNTATYFNPPGLTRAIAGVIGLLLNGVLQGKVEIALNTAAPSFLGIAIDPADPPLSGAALLGSSFVPLDLDGIAPYETLGFYLKVADLYGGFVTTTGDPIAGADGRADAISPKFIMNLLDQLGVWGFVGGAPSAAALGDGALPSSNLSFEPTHFSPDTLWDLSAINRVGKELELTPEEVKRLGLGEDSVWLTAAGLTPYLPSERMIFHYRIDGGVYQVGYGGKILIPPLFDGKHTIEVQAVDPEHYLDPTPAVLRFTLDRFPPMIRFTSDPADLGRNGIVSLGLEVSDLVTPRHAIKVSYALDDGDYKPLDPERPFIQEKVKKGEHILRIRAVDESGNLATRELRFVATGSQGWGCALGQGSGGLGAVGVLLTLILLGVSFLFLRRESRATSL